MSWEHNERGMALPAVVFTLAIMAVMASVAFRTADDERRSAWAAKESGVALYAAEAGLRSTMANWPSPEPMMAAGATLDLGWQLLPNKSTYHATIQRVDRGVGLQVFAVVVEAKSRGAQGGRSRISGMVAAVPTFTSGIFSEGDATISGGGFTDSYNSSVSPYNPAAADSGGSITTNGNIDLSGNPTIIKGDATARGTVSSGVVTGTVTNNAPPFPTKEIKPCPSGGFTPAAYLPSGSGISYNATSGALSLSGGGILTLPSPPSVFYFSSISLSGGSQLYTSGPSTIYVSGSVDFTGGTVVNSTTVPANLALVSCGTASTAGWKLSGGSGAYLTVYAPNHPITLSGSGDIYGALIGASYTSTGGSKLHFDEALLNAPTNRRVVLTGSWIQMGN
ncbi:MAG TPA: hypothetical protein VKD28_13505 [Gemmatimonadales bacterium]|nr:hypothetical protein [Gemmatimonadales bacterium]